LHPEPYLSRQELINFSKKVVNNHGADIETFYNTFTIQYHPLPGQNYSINDFVDIY